MYLTTRSARAKRCMIRYGARLVLSFGVNGSNKAIKNGLCKSGRWTDKVAARAKSKNNMLATVARGASTRGRIVRAPPAASHAPNTNSNCHVNGLKNHSPDG